MIILNKIEMPWKAELNKESGEYQIKNLDTKVLSKRQFKDKDKAEKEIQRYEHSTTRLKMNQKPKKYSLYNTYYGRGRHNSKPTPTPMKNTNCGNDRRGGVCVCVCVCENNSLQCPICCFPHIPSNVSNAGKLISMPNNI